MTKVRITVTTEDGEVLEQVTVNGTPFPDNAVVLAKEVIATLEDIFETSESGSR